MARDREQIYEASDWFKEALQKNQVMAVFCMKDNLLYMYVVCVYMLGTDLKPAARFKAVQMYLKPSGLF